MFQLTPAPKPRYRNFVAFVLAHRQRKYAFTCIPCNGDGKRYNPADRDPYEGYKLATPHICSTCNGKGKVSEAQMRVWYREHKDKEAPRLKAERDKRNLERAALRKARKHLTKTERQILGIEHV